MMTWSPDSAFLLGGGVLVLTFALTYPISILRDGTVSSSNFFLSDSIAKPPESQIGSFGLGISSFFVYHAIMFRYLHTKLLFETFLEQESQTTPMLPRKGIIGRTRFERVNYWTWCLGVMCTIFGFGIGCFQVIYWTYVHYTCAIGMFAGFTIYALIHTFYIDRKLRTHVPDYTIPVIREACSILSPLFMVGFFIFDRTGYVGSTEIPRELLGSIFEIGLVVSFALWVASLKGSTGDVKFSFEPYISQSKKCTISTNSEYCWDFKYFARDWRIFKPTPLGRIPSQISSDEPQTAIVWRWFITKEPDHCTSGVKIRI